MLLFAAAPAMAAPTHIVSLNPCLDTLIVALADRSQIAAVSHYARDPAGSTIAGIAATIPITHETAEEIIALSPDLVLASAHTDLATQNALRRLGIPLAFFDVPYSVAESEAQVRDVADLVGHPERGAALVARIDGALAAAAPPVGAAPISALVIQSSGFSVGTETLTDDLMRRAGFINVAGRYGIGQAGMISLERLLADPPTVLFTGVDPSRPHWADRFLRHPALHHAGLRRATLPQRLMYCGGPVLIDAVQAFAAARDRLVEAPP